MLAARHDDDDDDDLMPNLLIHILNMIENVYFVNNIFKRARLFFST